MSIQTGAFSEGKQELSLLSVCRKCSSAAAASVSLLGADRLFKWSSDLKFQSMRLLGGKAAASFLCFLSVSVEVPQPPQLVC